MMADMIEKRQSLQAKFLIKKLNECQKPKLDSLFLFRSQGYFDNVRQKVDFFHSTFFPKLQTIDMFAKRWRIKDFSSHIMPRPGSEHKSESCTSYKDLRKDALPPELPRPRQQKLSQEFLELEFEVIGDQIMNNQTERGDLSLKWSRYALKQLHQKPYWQQPELPDGLTLQLHL